MIFWTRFSQKEWKNAQCEILCWFIDEILVSFSYHILRIFWTRKKSGVYFPITFLPCGLLKIQDFQNSHVTITSSISNGPILSWKKEHKVKIWIISKFIVTPAFMTKCDKKTFMLFLGILEKIITKRHCVKSVRIRNYSGLYFPAFGLNTERYFVSLFNESEYGKIRTRITPNMDTFYVMCDKQKKFHEF